MSGTKSIDMDESDVEEYYDSDQDEVPSINISTTKVVKVPIINNQKKAHNFYCGSCKRTFYFEKSQTIIRCEHCGYRIIYKKRTNNHIFYKSE